MMKRHRHMQQKYFLRKLLHNLILITLPLFLLGFVLTLYSRGRLQQELSDYAERSKNALLDTVTNALDTFSEETALFSASPNFALSISRLLNEQSLDYRNSVYKDIIPTILGTTSNISTYVDSVYLYYDNPYGNYFSSIKQYTSVSAPNSTDSEWLSLYQKAPSGTKQWACLRMVRNYSFEEPVPVVSIFRRLDAGGVIILNLNADKLSALLEAGQIYAGSCTLIADQNGALIFGSSQAGSFTENGKLSPELAVLTEEKTSPYKTADIDETTYIYYTSEIPDYDLVMISLLPDAEVFRSVHTMVLAFALIILFSIILSFSLSLAGTISNFRQLKTLLELFSSAEQNQALPSRFRPQARNEYDLIFNNIIRTFVSNNLLKLNLAESKVHEKDAQLAALQLQLNPHFIFNTLQTLDLEVLKSQARDNHASLLIHNLSDIL